MNCFFKKIYIDGLFYKGAGIGRYYESLVKGLAEKGIKIYTCVPREFEDSFKQDFKNYLKNIVPIYVDYKKFSLKGFWSQGAILKNLEKEVCVFHFPHVNLPFYLPKNLVVTIHDLCPLTKFWDRGYFRRKIFEWHCKRAIEKSKKIVTASESSKKEIVNVYPACDAKIKVIYSFVDEKFLRNKDFYRKKRLIKDDYILFVGNRKKHKNLSRLIFAFKQVKNEFPDLKLVIAGKKDSEIDEVDLLKNKLNLGGEIIEIISPDDEKVINLYSYAKIFIFPSLCEGFGLPPLEAIACGCPAITSNIPVLEEVLGKNIACFNPCSVDDIADKIIKALVDEKKRKRLLEEGKKRLKLYSSRDKAINQYLELFYEVSKS